MNKICPAYDIQMGTILGKIFCRFHKDGCILGGGGEFSVHFSKVGTFSGKNVCTYGHKFVPEPSITSKIHREPSPPGVVRYARLYMGCFREIFCTFFPGMGTFFQQNFCTFSMRWVLFCKKLSVFFVQGGCFFVGFFFCVFQSWVPFTQNFSVFSSKVGIF